jgi:hypothetical protein
MTKLVTVDNLNSQFALDQTARKIGLQFMPTTSPTKVKSAPQSNSFIGTMGGVLAFPALWMEVEINGTKYRVPCYKAESETLPIPFQFTLVETDWLSGQALQNIGLRFTLPSSLSIGDIEIVSAEGLPKGVTLNPQTKKFEGTPTGSGRYNINIEAAEPYGFHQYLSIVVYVSGDFIVKSKSNVVSSSDVDYDPRATYTGWQWQPHITEVANYTLSNREILKQQNVVLPNQLVKCGDESFAYWETATGLDIGDGVKELGEQAFFSWSKATKLRLGPAIKSIGDSCFGRWYILEEVICEAVSPPTMGYDPFMQGNNSFAIKVPSGSVAAYKAAPGWRDYAARIVAI